MSGELIAPQDQLKEVGYDRLPKAAKDWGELTQHVANVGAVGPAGGKAAELAKLVYDIVAETADRLQDSAVAVCKIYHRYELTDELNAKEMPDDAGIVPQNPLSPRTDLN